MRGSIREKTAGVWEIRVELPRDPATMARRQQWRVVRGTKRKAEHELGKLLVSAQDARARSSQASVEFIINAWFEAASQTLSPKTIDGYRWRIRDHLLPTLGSIPVDELTAAQIDAVYRSLVAKGDSPTGIRQTHAILRRALNQAIKWGWLEKNVALQASPPKALQATIVSPTPEQLVALLLDAEKLEPQWAAMITLAAVTGMRRGEILALRWGDIGEGMIHVRRSLAYTPATGILEGPTKTRQERRISLDQIGMAVVERQVAALTGVSAKHAFELSLSPFLFFASPDGLAPFHPDSISKVFRKLADGRGWRDLHFHSLRHFTATQLIAAGVDIRTVSGRLGHSDASVTLRVYSHVLEAKDREAAEIMGRLLGK